MELVNNVNLDLDCQKIRISVLILVSLIIVKLLEKRVSPLIKDRIYKPNVQNAMKTQAKTKIMFVYNIPFISVRRPTSSIRPSVIHVSPIGKRMQTVLLV